jgi:hypothetical protein
MYATIDMMTADKVQKLMQPLIDKGCFYDYFYFLLALGLQQSVLSILFVI